MTMCKVCKQQPAVHDDMCPACHANRIRFKSSPVPVVHLIILRILCAAVEGGLRIEQSDVIELKVMKMIGRTEGTLCGCGGCNNPMTMADVCYSVIRDIEKILDEFRELHGVDDVD